MFRSVFVWIVLVNPTRLILLRTRPRLSQDSGLFPSLPYTNLKAFESLPSKKKHRPQNYCYLHEPPNQLYCGIGVAQYSSATAYLRHHFSLLFSPEVEFQLKMPIFFPELSRIGQNELQVRFICHFLHWIRKTRIFGFTRPLTIHDIFNDSNEKRRK